MRLVLAALISIFSWSSVSAGLPWAQVKFKNLKISREEKNKIGRAWFNFLEEKPDLLLKTKKDGTKTSYRIDQFCRFNANLDEEGNIDLDSLELLKHRKNFAYNIRAIEFLRKQDFNFAEQIKDPEKPIRIEFKYFSY